MLFRFFNLGGILWLKCSQVEPLISSWSDICESDSELSNKQKKKNGREESHRILNFRPHSQFALLTGIALLSRAENIDFIFGRNANSHFLSFS